MAFLQVEQWRLRAGSGAASAAGRRIVTRMATVMLAMACTSAATLAQTPAPSDSPATQQSAPQQVPPPQPAPASSLPSLPAYQDPLLAPLNVKPGKAQPATVVPPPTVTTAQQLAALGAYDNLLPISTDDHKLSSTYIPLDSTVYPMALRLYSLGYLDTAFINMRPWTRLALLHMLQASRERITTDNNPQAMELLAKLLSYVQAEAPAVGSRRGQVYGVDTVYTRLMGIQGLALRDGYHLGQTIVNDYGRPYEQGFNSIVGFSTVTEHGPFSLYVRGEYQHAPSAVGYSQALSSELSGIDAIPYSGYNLNQATIPTGPIAAQNPFRLQEATLSYHLLGHEISAGKSDSWVGPGLGGGMAWSNNAEDIYSFRINRVEPLHIPLFSRVFGDMRYDFFVGSLKGHTYPNEPWIHSETVSLTPTPNFQFGFQRTVIWGGKGHEPINLHSFLRSFFSLDDTESDPTSKNTADDPGARYSTFNFSWRLPFLRHYVTLYTDSIVHDDVTPPSAPRRAAYRPGIYLSQFPHFRKLDLRVEGVSTDTSTLRSQGGQFNYYEGIQRQGYTNKGFLMGDWIGREAKGGQAWLTYHLSGNEWVQLEYLKKKTPKDFIPGGTTQDQFEVNVVKRLRRDLELNASYQYEAWKAPIYVTNTNNANNHDQVFSFQFTWFPKLHTGEPGVK